MGRWFRGIKGWHRLVSFAFGFLSPPINAQVGGGGSQGAGVRQKSEPQHDSWAA